MEAKKIYEVRGVKVMIDSDLASLLNYETFNFNFFDVTVDF